VRLAKEKERRKPEELYFPAVLRLIAGTIDRNINISQLVFTFQHSSVKGNFPLKLPEGWMFSKLKITDTANSLLN